MSANLISYSHKDNNNPCSKVIMVWWIDLISVLVEVNYILDIRRLQLRNNHSDVVFFSTLSKQKSKSENNLSVRKIEFIKFNARVIPKSAD